MFETRSCHVTQTSLDETWHPPVLALLSAGITSLLYQPWLDYLFVFLYYRVPCNYGWLHTYYVSVTKLNFLFKIINFICTGILPACISVYHVHIVPLASR